METHGYSEKWIQQRMTGQETRNKLTDYWKEHDINEPNEFAILTNIIHQEYHYTKDDLFLVSRAASLGFLEQSKIPEGVPIKT